MSRKTSNTVDYFPHNATQGTTVFIIKSRFGNNGYAFWFQLQEVLCQSENHYYDCRTPELWQYLIAFCGSNEITGTEMLNLLATLGDIDNSLWQKKIIWSQALVNNLADVYKKRGRQTPLKPVIDNIKAIPATSNEITGTEMPQSKVKYSKVKYSKVTASLSPSNNTPDWVPKESWEAFLEMRRQKKSMPTAHAQNLLIKELDKLRLAGDDPAEVLNRSTMNSWKGIFALDRQGGQDGKGRRNPQAVLKPGQYTRPESLR